MMMTDCRHGLAHRASEPIEGRVDRQRHCLCAVCVFVVGSSLFSVEWRHRRIASARFWHLTYSGGLKARDGKAWAEASQRAQAQVNVTVNISKACKAVIRGRLNS
jgi:hypothetical protein